MRAVPANGCSVHCTLRMVGWLAAPQRQHLVGTGCSASGLIQLCCKHCPGRALPGLLGSSQLPAQVLRLGFCLRLPAETDACEVACRNPLAAPDALA